MEKVDGGHAVVLVTGAGGFIGGHLVGSLLADGQRVRAVDVKPLDEWHQVFPAAQNVRLDLRRREACRQAARGARRIYNLAADMGGMGFIESNKAACMLSVLINTQLLEAAREAECERYFYASSACVYNVDRQSDPVVTALRECDVYPAMPADGYGWEKLFGEHMCRHFREDYGLACRIARYHNVYGEQGTWDGGREKAPAAICRKVAEAKLSGRHEIEIWGDGRQTRSFMYVADCVYGTKAIMDADVEEPINLGSDELVTIDGLVDVVEEIAGVELRRRYDPRAPQGVRGRNSDNTLIRRTLGWAPSIPLREGMERTYRWVFDQLVRRGDRRPALVS
jgi:nucleoside-diphosphate-sugar epimerase